MLFRSKSGGQADLFSRNRAHVAALRAHGAHITGRAELTVPVRALTPEEMEGVYDVILLMTKQLDNRRVVTSLLPHLAPDGVIVTVQNGLPEPLIAGIAGPSRTVGCVVEWGATWLAPGECALTSDPEKMLFRLGGMEGVSREKLLAVKELLELMCPATLEDNFSGVRWTKLLINAAFTGLGTVIGGLFGDVAERPEVRRVAIRTLKECMEVGRAAGVDFAPVKGLDVTRLFYYTSDAKRIFAQSLLPLAMRRDRTIEPSMLQDIKKGKLCEIDAVNGVVCGQGRRLGVPTPFNDRIVAVVHEEEAGRLPLAPENIRFFDSLL